MEQREVLTVHALSVLSCSYAKALEIFGLLTLYDRREAIAAKLFNEICANQSHSLHKLLPSKYQATGLDSLPAQLLKDSAVVIADCVTHLVNLSIKSGMVLSEWKQAKVVPLFKSGNKDDLDNYRPISILPIL